MNKSISFNDLPLGPYTEEKIRRDWNNPKRIMGVKSCRAEIVIDPLDAEKHVLEIKYPKGKVGQEEDGGGAQWRMRFGEAYEKVTVEYKVFFPIGFDFVKGGKLPGLCGGTSPAGGKKSDGSDGFSARIMWREDGQVFQYMYWMERAPEKNWGDDLPWNVTFIPGQWHTLKTEITMNTPGERNGLIKSWFDGKLALETHGAFRAEGAIFGIDNFNFTTFFGGSTPDWAPTKDESIYFDDFKISTTKVNNGKRLDTFGLPIVDSSPMGIIAMEGQMFRGMTDKGKNRSVFVRTVIIFVCVLCFLIPGLSGLYFDITFLSEPHPDKNLIVTLIPLIGSLLFIAAGIAGIKANIKKS